MAVDEKERIRRKRLEEIRKQTSNISDAKVTSETSFRLKDIPTYDSPSKRPQTVTRFIKERAVEGVGDRARNFFSGTGRNYGSGFNPSSPRSNSGSALKWIVILSVIGFILFIAGPLYADCTESGFCETKIIQPIEPVYEGVKDSLSFVGTQLGESKDIISGKKTFDWEGDAEERVRSGIWFENGFSSGITLSSDEDGTVKETLGEEFGAVTTIVVGKIDENLKEIEAEIECSLEDIRGIIVGAKVKEEKRDEINNLVGYTHYFNLTNPYPKNEREYDVNCLFRGEPADKIRNKLETNRTYFSGDIYFNLTYSITSGVTLPVFVLDDELYEDYAFRRNDAFEKEVNGIYDEYSSGVISKTDYNSDLDAVMKFIQNPYFNSDEESSFGVQFSKKTNANVQLKEFKFKLPQGITLRSDCNNFILEEGYYKLKQNKIDEINNFLKKNTNIAPKLCIVDISKVEYASPLTKIGIVSGQYTYEASVSNTVKIGN